jgi:hypothetical protein
MLSGAIDGPSASAAAQRGAMRHAKSSQTSKWNRFKMRMQLTAPAVTGTSEARPQLGLSGRVGLQVVGRGALPRLSAGTLQLSIRCSSIHFLPNRSLPVRDDGEFEREFGWPDIA